MLKQCEWEKINLIICEINKTKDIKKMRKEILGALYKLVSFDLAYFYIGGVSNTNKVKLIAPVVVSKFSEEFNEKFIMNYENHFIQVDYAKWICASSESIVYRESDLINNDIRIKSSFYLDYLKPAGLINVAGVSIADKGHCIGAITFYRTEQHGDFTDKELYIVYQLLPHLQNKLAVEHEAIKSDIIDNVSYQLAQGYNLTIREIEIIKLLCDGKNNKEICDLLFISINTVKKHIANIFSKLKVDSRAKLLNYLIKNEKELFEEGIVVKEL